MPAKKEHLDELDYQILRALHADARCPAAEIARQTISNERTVRKRIEWLVENGIIRLTAILDPEAFGYMTAADIFLEADPTQEKAILEQLVQMPEVTYVAFGQGSNEISLEARFKNNEQLREFLRARISGLPGVKVSRYTLVPRIFRNIDEWFPPRTDFSPGDK